MSVFTGLTDFDPVPSLQTSASVTVSTKADADAPVIGYLVARDGDDPGEHGCGRRRIRGSRFRGQGRPDDRSCPSADGPLTVLVGVGELADLDADRAEGCRSRLRPGHRTPRQPDPDAGRDRRSSPPTLPARWWWRGLCWPGIDTTS